MITNWEKKLKDRVIVITGASSGLGEHLIREAARRGARCGLIARRQDRMDALVAELCIEHGMSRNRFSIQVADVASEAALKAALSAIVQEFGQLDYLIANAGFGVGGAFHRLTTPDLQRQWDINVWGVVNTVNAGFLELKKSQGALGIVSSVMGYVTAPETIPYAMSKYAVRSLCEGLYVEYSKFGMGVTLITPGFIKTEIRQVNNHGQFDPAAKDPVPSWLMAKPQVAARKVLRAVVSRRREIVFPLHAKLLVCLAGFMRGPLYLCLRMIGRRKSV